MGISVEYGSRQAVLYISWSCSCGSKSACPHAFVELVEFQNFGIWRMSSGHHCKKPATENRTKRSSRMQTTVLKCLLPAGSKVMPPGLSCNACCSKGAEDSLCFREESKRHMKTHWWIGFCGACRSYIGTSWFMQPVSWQEVWSGLVCTSSHPGESFCKTDLWLEEPALTFRSQTNFSLLRVLCFNGHIFLICFIKPKAQPCDTGVLTCINKYLGCYHYSKKLTSDPKPASPQLLVVSLLL